MKSKIVALLVLLLPVVVTATVEGQQVPRGSSGDLRCNDRLVNLGDTKADVSMKCGSPSSQETHQRKRRSVTVDVWMYNLGPNQFIRTLTFENDRLVKIDQGGYGS